MFKLPLVEKVSTDCLLPSASF